MASEPCCRAPDLLPLCSSIEPLGCPVLVRPVPPSLHREACILSARIKLLTSQATPYPRGSSTFPVTIMHLNTVPQRSYHSGMAGLAVATLPMLERIKTALVIQKASTRSRFTAQCPIKPLHRNDPAVYELYLLPGSSPLDCCRVSTALGLGLQAIIPVSQQLRAAVHLKLAWGSQLEERWVQAFLQVPAFLQVQDDWLLVRALRVL